MFKKLIPFALMAALAGVTGCAQPGERIEGGGGGTGRTAAEQAAAQDAVAWGTTLTGDKRTLAEAAARVGWMQANVAAREWEQAGEDLADIEDDLARLSRDPDVPAAVQRQLTAFQPLITQAGRQLKARDAAAMQTSKRISDQFANLMASNTTVAWFSEGAGGGAGTGGTMHQNRK